MASEKVQQTLLWIVSLVLAILSLLLFALMMALAVASLLLAQKDDERYASGPNDDYENYWYVYMCGSTATVIPLCALSTLTMLSMIAAIQSSQEHKMRVISWGLYSVIKTFTAVEFGHKPGNHSTKSDIEMQNHDSEVITERKLPARDRIDSLKDKPMVDLDEFKGAPLSDVTFGAAVSLFAAIVLLGVSLQCFLWGIAIAEDHATHTDKEVWPYVIVELLVGLVMPILIIISVIIFTIFLKYITQGSIDGRVLLAQILPVVKIVKGKRNDYWVILKRFYFQISSFDSKVRHSEKPKSCIDMCSRTPSTWIIIAIASIGFLLGVTYFMNDNIAQQSHFTQCPRVDYKIDCFNGSFIYVDCSNADEASNATELHCFRFLRFGQDSDIIGGLAKAFAFYLTTIAFFAAAFHIVEILINFKPSRLWGIPFLVLGAILFIIASGISFSRGAVLLRLDIVQMAQLYMISFYIFLVGLLVLISKWWQKVGNVLICPDTIKEVESKLDEKV